MDNTGIDPVTYRMQSDRSTIWASHPIQRPLIFNLFQFQHEWVLLDDLQERDVKERTGTKEGVLG